MQHNTAYLAGLYCWYEIVSKNEYSNRKRVEIVEVYNIALILLSTGFVGWMNDCRIMHYL